MKILSMLKLRIFFVLGLLIFQMILMVVTKRLAFIDVVCLAFYGGFLCGALAEIKCLEREIKHG